MRPNLRHLPPFFCILVAVPNLHAMDPDLGAGPGPGSRGTASVVFTLSMD